MKHSSIDCIRLKGVRQNNLKGFDIDVPLGKLIVVTGLSGSGKSSFAFDTLHAEGQRRYVETFSPYTRQFLEMLDRPDVESIENIRPSIAIGQSNTVRTSRSTVGTMTELCDFFKVWFCHVASLYDPESGEKIEDDSPQSIWKKVLSAYENKILIITFKLNRPDNFLWDEILQSLTGQGFQRILTRKAMRRIEQLTSDHISEESIYVIQDRLRIETSVRARFIDAAQTALHFGQGQIHIFSSRGKLLNRYSEGLNSPVSGRQFRRPSPPLFSFNSPVGACPTCRGFGRIIEIDYRLVIPDQSLSIREGAVRAFQGTVYSESQRDLIKTCRKAGIPIDRPFSRLTEEERSFVTDGEPDYGIKGREWPRAWYGVKRFFEWLEGNTYKMHVRVFLSKFRAYTKCPACQGTRLQPDSLHWKWRGRILPELYKLPVSDLLALIERHHRPTQNHQVDIAVKSILTRLQYLEQVGLGYLTLDRSSRTLSGGEVERVNLTSCLGTCLVDTLFVLDEPSIGLHSRDIDRLISILKSLTRQGNTVIVVEHDESIMRAADEIIELGPGPGREGGYLVYAGELKKLRGISASITGDYLHGRRSIDLPKRRRRVSLNGRKSARGKTGNAWLRISHATKHNIRSLSLKIPLKRLVGISGVSGSGKSTLLNNVIYQGLLAQMGRAVEDPASIRRIESDTEISEVVIVDQTPISRTPRSNAVLFSEAWNPIRELFAATEQARSSGYTASSFSFNSGDGRCEFCKGLGYERIEMQFMADVYVTCQVCDGKRFKSEVLAITFRDKSISDILELNVSATADFFDDKPRIRSRLLALDEVGLGYLPLGQPLNTLSGGESQRLKLVKYLSRFGGIENHSLLLLDEPTTGMHRHDVKRLITVLQKLVDLGHTLIVIEHHLDILKSADWLIEMGPEAGRKGGKVVCQGTPEKVSRYKAPTSPFLKETLLEAKFSGRSEKNSPQKRKAKGAAPSDGRKIQSFYATKENLNLLAAEEPGPYRGDTPRAVEIVGARENNLRNLSLSIPHREVSVVTGVSGSGKSSLAFDIVFAEGQRRFMESMSPYARQFVEQMARPDIDLLSGIPPTVAIEQRVTHGTRKSTVATITEVAQYLRLLYARIGIQHGRKTGRPLVTRKPAALLKRLNRIIGSLAKKAPSSLFLCSPLVRGRKGHYQPLADWAADHHFSTLRIDGHFVEISDFRKLDRYREHDIEVVVHGFQTVDGKKPRITTAILNKALKLGKGTCFLDNPKGEITAWLSTKRTDPVTGESYPDLDPKHFSWNSPKGWCLTCHGYGRILKRMHKNDDYPDEVDNFEPGTICPRCTGSRLNENSGSVFLYFKDGRKLALPDLLSLTPRKLVASLRNLKLDRRGTAIVKDVVPEIEERLKFMEAVGLGYLSLERATATLSGGEAQRIRLAAQLGSNLSGVLYVLDEPSIGLHARDNNNLLKSLQRLRAKGNTLLIVEHDEDTMRFADRIIDLGPGAGIHGGDLLASGSLAKIKRHKTSLTGQYLRKGITHPLRGSYRTLPPPNGRHASKGEANWLIAEGVALRNLKGGTLALPLGRLIMICGISGAGKSTLVRDLLKPAVVYSSKNGKRILNGRTFTLGGGIETEARDKPAFKRLLHGDGFRHVIEVDQSPIGKTPRSTPATYIGAFDIIRRFFGSLPEARMLGHSPSTYSFNTKNGRCEKCKGAGRIKLEMSFMPDTYVICEDCGGKRYGNELNEIRWKGKNIAEVLEMSFEEAASFFDFHSRLKEMLDLMVETGLGYLTLGQSSPTLSGGEAQRLKLVSELAKGLQTYTERSRAITPTSLYILEEPTIGLHLSDCEKLIELLHRLVDQGHTVIVIEHNIDLIAEADYVVEIGPEGGDAGGEILYQGPVSGLRDCPDSPTAPYLREKI